MKKDGHRWAFLADPEDFGWTELVEQGEAVWDGINNARAQQYLRECHVGDLILVYHTAPDKAIIGTARVSAEAYPDPKNSDKVVVDVEPVTALTRPLPLAEIKQDDVLSQMSFVKMPRVAVQPITIEQWERVMQKSGTDLGKSVGTNAVDAGGP